MELEQIINGVRNLGRKSQPLPGEYWRDIKSDEKVWYAPNGLLHTVVAIQFVEDAGISDLASATLIPYEEIEKKIEGGQPFQLRMCPGERVYHDTYHALEHPRLPTPEEQIVEVHRKQFFYIENLGTAITRGNPLPEEYHAYAEQAEKKIPNLPLRVRR